ncbi:phytanoyl-CoA dioxygenase family protein [Oscillatoria sp. FACHB-1407]|nr:phytanoyl-CoA dioxygenase family protein [Oscillatoria sp. FACHB-1407]MBD2463823.1 phytanoyl-CoA dioxygenase family protein [Oscillatoria sp. FACHB-1407]
MTEIERYLFDLWGFIVVEDALTLEQVSALNEAIAHQVNQFNASPEQLFIRFNHLLPFGEPFLHLIDNPRVTPYLLELLGDKFRLDHEYAHILRPGCRDTDSVIHGGGTPFDPCQYYHYQSGRMYNGLTAIAYNLTDVLPGEGGFGYIPGSHKSNLSLPKELAYLDLPHPCLQALPVKAGSAIIFTEALTHGTLPWTGQSDRRTLFYKYSPYPSAWYRIYYNPDDYPQLTESQRALLRPPGFYPY